MALKPHKPLKKISKPLKPLVENPSTLELDESTGSYEGDEAVKAAFMSEDLQRAKEANRKQREGLKELNDGAFWLGIYFPHRQAKLRFIDGMGWGGLIDCNGSEYFVICFQNREQKEAFLEGMNWWQFTEGIYIDGELLAKHHNVNIYDEAKSEYSHDIFDGVLLAKMHKIKLPSRKRDYDVGKLDKEAQTLL